MSLFAFGVLFGALLMLIIASSIDTASQVFMFIILCVGTYGAAIAIGFI